MQHYRTLAVFIQQNEVNRGKMKKKKKEAITEPA